MLLIYYTLESAFKREYTKRSKDFQKGYLECLRLLEIGMNKNPSFNAHVENDQLKKDIQLLRKSEKEKDWLFRDLQKKLQDKSLVAKPPVRNFRVYEVELVNPLGNNDYFTIVANLQEETFKNMVANFSGRFTWTDTQDAKAKMLTYINSKTAQGFKAYKDEKTAIKDEVKIKRT